MSALLISFVFRSLALSFSLALSLSFALSLSLSLSLSFFLALSFSRSLPKVYLHGLSLFESRVKHLLRLRGIVPWATVPGYSSAGTVPRGIAPLTKTKEIIQHFFA